MKIEQWKELAQRGELRLWEAMTNDTCSIKQLDRNRIKQCILTAVNKKRLPESALEESLLGILRNLRLLVDDKLTNAAVILFCKDESEQFLQSSIQLVRFRGIDKTEIVDNTILRGNAFDLYDQAMDFLPACLSIPRDILHEALANALVHRDYNNADGQIVIAVYDDRVVINSAGRLPKNMPLVLLSQNHSSFLRNPLIANAFYLCGKIEKWGRGTWKMIEDCKKVGNPLPIYEEIGDTFSITLPLKEPIRMMTSSEIKPVEELTERQKKIITLLRNGPLSRAQIMEKLGVMITGRAVQTELAKFQRMGLIRSTGKARSIT